MSDHLKKNLLFEHKSEVKRYFVDQRFIGLVTGGKIEGPKVNGKILGGGDFAVVSKTGIINIDARSVYELDDGHIAYVQFIGRFFAEPRVMDMIKSGRAPAINEYYYRASFVFETDSERYKWLNSICGYSLAQVMPPENPTGNIYRVYSLDEC